MTRIRQPDSGKPRAHQIVWETGEAQGSAAGAGISGRSLDDLAPDSVRAAPGLRVVWHGGRGCRSDFLSCCLPAAGRQRGFQQYVPPCCLAYPGEDARVTSQPGQPGVEPGPARCGPGDRGGDRGGRRGRLRDGIRQSVRGSPVPGHYLAAAPRSRQAQLLPGWPVSHSSLWPPAVVPALPRA